MLAVPDGADQNGLARLAQPGGRIVHALARVPRRASQATTSRDDEHRRRRRATTSSQRRLGAASRRPASPVRIGRDEDHHVVDGVRPDRRLQTARAPGQVRREQAEREAVEEEPQRSGLPRCACREDQGAHDRRHAPAPTRRRADPRPDGLGQPAPRRSTPRRRPAAAWSAHDHQQQPHDVLLAASGRDPVDADSTRMATTWIDERDAAGTSSQRQRIPPTTDVTHRGASRERPDRQHRQRDERRQRAGC